jgi:paraquat-inducible protein B
MMRVTLEILPDTYIPISGGVPIEEGLREAIPHDTLIREAGLRAQLEIESFVTGQLLVRLDMRPDTPIQMAGIRSEHPEIPTIRSDIQVLLARMQAWLSNISDTVDIDALAQGFTNALMGFAALTNSPDLHESLAGLNAFINNEDTQALSASLTSLLDELGVAVTDASELFNRADTGMNTLVNDVLPVLQQLGDTLQTAERTLQVAQLLLRGDSEQVYQLQSTLKEVENAATALREFFDYLERNPESLIRGKRE